MCQSNEMHRYNSSYSQIRLLCNEKMEFIQVDLKCFCVALNTSGLQEFKWSEVENVLDGRKKWTNPDKMNENKTGCCRSCQAPPGVVETTASELGRTATLTGTPTEVSPARRSHGEECVRAHAFMCKCGTSRVSFYTIHTRWQFDNTFRALF